MTREEFAVFMQNFNENWKRDREAFSKRTDAIEKRTEELVQELKDDRLENRRFFKELLDRLNK